MSSNTADSLNDAFRSPVLIVDDRVDSLLALRASLEPLGQPIITARSGDEALRHLLREPVAVILLDVNMPDMDGFTTAALIKQRVRTRDIPIIFLTAERDATELGQVELGYSSGAVDFIVKPFDPWVLMSKVSVFVQLHRTTEQLRHQLEELRAGRTALATAQRIAKLVHFEVDVRNHHVSWSDGAATTLGLAKANGVENIDQLLRSWPELIAPPAERDRAYYHEVVERPDGSSMDVVARAEYVRDRTGRLTKITGTLQDVTEQLETRRALAQVTGALEREQQAVTLLQTSMLPAAIPQPPGLDIAARYIPAEVGVGGDWYDVTWRPDGRVMLVIGDVAGHGLGAASTMNEIRIAARSFAMRDASPGRVLRELNSYAEVLGRDILVTALIMLLDPATGKAVAASAGHLPAVLSTPEGWSFVDIDVGPPLGTGRGTPPESSFMLPLDGRLLLYTDGLVEQRRANIDDRLSELGTALAEADGRAELVADHLVRRMISAGSPSDDVALLVVHRSPSADLTITMAADPARLSTLRSTLRRWLDDHDVNQTQVRDLVLAAGELATNVCIHAHPQGDGLLQLSAELDGGLLRLSVRDSGRWQPELDRGGGRGLAIVRSLVDDVSIETDESGTFVTITAKVVTNDNGPAE